MAEVTIKLGDQVLQTHAFEGDLLRVGRSRENDIVLENLSVSRHHVQIRYHEGQYVLFDMNSSNGTFLNGTRITRRELMDGDQINVGKHVLIWHDLSEQPTVMQQPELEDAGNAHPRKKASEARAEAWVKVESGRLKDREFKIVRFETTIGKAPTNDIVLTDDWLLAKKQAVILRRGNDEFVIEALSGIRRVKVNGTPVDEPVTIRTGDKLEVGGTRLGFYSTAAKHPSAPAQIIVRHRDEPKPGEESDQADEPAADEPQVAASAGAASVLDNDSFDMDGLFEPPSGPQSAAMPAENNDEDEDYAPAFSANGNGSGFGAHGINSDDGSSSQAAGSRVSSASLASSQQREQNPAVNDKELQVWESALNNPSPAIRRQAAKMLKKLTGRDYDV